MNHRVFGNRLSRPADQRKSLYRVLIFDLLSKGKLVTTRAKAKAVVPQVDKVVNLITKGDSLSLRKLQQLLPTGGAGKLFAELKDRFGKRKSGFTRITLLGKRLSDASDMVNLELLTEKTPVVPVVEKVEKAEKVEEVKETKEVKKVKKVKAKK